MSISFAACSIYWIHCYFSACTFYMAFPNSSVFLASIYWT